MKRKILYLLCVLSLLAINVLYVDYEFFIILLVVLVVPLVSWLLFAVSIVGLKMCINPEKKILTNGESVKLYLWTANRRHLFVGRHEVHLEVSYVADDKQQYAQQVHTEIDGRTAAIVYCPNHSGILNIHIYQINIQDCMGMFQAKRKYRGNCRVIVFPERVDATHQSGIYDIERPYRHSILEDETDIVDLRAFREGDKLNRIHWNLSLRSEDMIVRQYGQEIHADKYLLADLSVPEESGLEVLDRLYQAVYSAGSLYVENGLCTALLFLNTDTEKMEEFYFQTLEELEYAMRVLMQMNMQKDMTDEVVYMYMQHVFEDGQESVLFTHTDYPTDMITVANLSDTPIIDIVNYLWEQL